MQFNALFLAVTALFAASTQACKCMDGDENSDMTVTTSCCSVAGGSAGSDDCNADSISEHLSDFDTCCGNSGLVSDCDYPDSILPIKE